RRGSAGGCVANRADDDGGCKAGGNDGNFADSRVEKFPNRLATSPYCYCLPHTGWEQPEQVTEEGSSRQLLKESARPSWPLLSSWATYEASTPGEPGVAPSVRR